MVEITIQNNTKIDTDKVVSEYLTVPKVQTSPAKDMRVTMSSAVDQNPDQTAELQKISRRTGVPLSALKDPENKRTVEKQETLSTFNFDAYTQAFPESARFLATPEIAAISHDDVDTIGGVETVVKKLGNATRATGAGIVGFGSGTLGVARESFLLMGQYEETTGDFRGRAKAYTALGQFFGMGQQAGNTMRDDILAPALDGAGLIESGIYSGVSSLSSQAPGLIASVATRNPSFALANAGVVSGGTAAGEALDQGLDPVAAGLFGLRDAAIEVGTELIPITRFIGDVSGGSGFFKTIRNQILTEVPGELAATTLQNLNEWATLNPDEPFQTYLDQLPADLAQTVVATLTSVGLQTGAVQLSSSTIQRLQNRMGDAQGAINEAQSLEELVELAQASKTLQRDAESFETWVESLSEGREVTDIYIDPEELAQSGVDIDALTEVSPSVAKQRDTAVGTGSLLKIPVSEFAASIAPTELGQSLIEVAKTDPHSMSKREAEEFMQNSMERLEEDIEQELTQSAEKQAQAQPRKNVEQNILTQLQQANRFTEDVNKPYAALLGNFYETIGERTGQTAEEVFAQYPVAIQAQSVDGEVVFNQEDLELEVSSLQEDILSKYPVKTLSLYPSSSGDLKMNVLIVNEDSRKTGVGSAVTQEVVDFADSKGLRVTLSPAVQDDFQGTTSRKRLVNFYKRFGFVENKGRNKDFSISDSMYREPKKSEFNQDKFSSELDKILEELGDITYTDQEQIEVDNFLAENERRGEAERQREAERVEALAARARRLQRFRDSFGVRENTAAWTEQRVDDVISTYAKANGETKAQIGFVDPIDFLLATAPLDRAKIIEEEAGELDRDRLAKEGQTPFLIIENNKIIGHEGRHRMVAMAKAGVKRAPVVLRDYGRGYDTSLESIAKIPLEAQQFLEGGDATENLTVFDVEPATYDAAEKIKASMSDQNPSVLFQTAQDVTDTPEFKKWFGDSKVVDDSGNPIVVYHGTDQNIEEFSPTQSLRGDGGIFETEVLSPFNFFTPDISLAALAADARGGRNILKTYLKMEKPLDMRTEKGLLEAQKILGVDLSVVDGIDQLQEEISDLEQQISEERSVEVKAYSQFVKRDDQNNIVGASSREKEGYVFEEFSIQEAEEQQQAFIRGLEKERDSLQKQLEGSIQPSEIPSVWDKLDDPDSADKLKSAGYDGVVFFENTGETTYAVSDSNQIKSVKNEGTFDPDNPNIFKQERRGSFNPDTSTISLLQAADLSTFLHESGHFFLETLGSIASDPNAPQQIKDDMDTALEWMKVDSLENWQEMSIEEQRDAHEQFARGFEAYLFEGKAPGVELQGIFQRFRSWLVNIYRELRNLNVELNDEVRGVFDRMIATDNMIAEAETMRGMRPMFDNAEEAGMTEDEWLSYQELGAEATADAIENLEARSLRDMKWLGNAKAREIKKLQKDAKQKRRTIRNEVEVEVMSEPVNQAHRFITRGEYMIPDNANKKQRRLATELATGEGGTKMSLQSLEDTYGKDDQIWQGLPTGKYGLVSKKGMDFNAIAELFGYASGDQMLQQLLTREDPKVKIEALTDQRMLERYGDISDPVALERAADAAIHNDARTRFVAAEMNALQKATGGRKVLASAAKQLAETMIARLRIRDVKPSRYTAAEAKAARNADKARRSGDMQEAAVQKRNQLVQMYAAKAAINAREQNEKDLRYLKKFDRDGSRKSIDVEYLDQIDAILERFDLKKSTSLREIDKRKSLADWLLEQEDLGIEPDIAPEITDLAFRKHYKDMSVEEMRGIVDTVKQIEHLGRLKNKLLTLKDKRQFNEVVEELVGSIEENFNGKIKDNTTRATAGDRVKRLFRGYLAQHRKIASLSRQMDGVQDGGQMWEVFIRTMNEAGDREASMREEATVQLAKISEKIIKLGKMGGKGTYFESLNRSLNREERLAIVLNMGNEGNMQRLLDGKGWTREQVQPVLESMTAAEFQFVQEVWDLFESYRPQIGAKERRIYGKEPEWIEPTPLETPFGELRGGYYPIKYDTRQSAQAAQTNDAEVAKQQLRGAYTSATTRRSFTKSRADEVVERPLLITMDALYGGLNEVVHDLSWHEWLIDANRLLRSKRLSKAILETQGAENFQQFKDAVRDIAAGEMPSGSAFEKASAHLRAGATVAGLGLSISTSLINVTGLAQSFVRVGPRYIVQGINQWATNPTSFVGTIYEKSDFMRLRGKTMQREINEVQSMLRDKTKVRQAIDNISFMPLVYTQVAVDAPTWWGAYQKALTEGNTEDRAVALADQSVIDAQGGGQVKDLAGIQRGGPLLKLWTTFYSYFSTTYQLTVEQTSKTNFKDPMDVLRLGGDYFMLYIIPAFLGSVIRGAISGDEDWNDPEELAKAYVNEQLSFAFGTMVGLRETTGFAQKALGVNQYFGGYGGPAGLRFFNELDRLGAQVGQGELDQALAKSVVNVGGVLLRLPSSQTNRTIDGMVAIMEGETQNPASLVFGAPKN